MKLKEKIENWFERNIWWTVPLTFLLFIGGMALIALPGK